MFHEVERFDARLQRGGSPVSRACSNSCTRAARNNRWRVLEMAAAKFAIVTKGAIGLLLADDRRRAGFAHREPFVGPAGDEVDRVVDNVRTAGHEAGQVGNFPLKRQTVEAWSA